MNQLTEHNTNQELLKYFTTGKPDAFSQVYQQYYFKVYQYTRQWLPQPQDAEDITADVFIKLWNRRQSFETFDAIAAFLFTAAKNACYDILRHRQVKSAKEKELLRRFTESRQTDFTLQEIREEFLKLVYAEVEKMPVKMREIFLMSYRDGLKPIEIANLLNLSVQTVRNQKTNAVNLLKQVFAGKPLFIALLLMLENSTVWQA